MSEIKTLVYYQGALGGTWDPMPGTTLEAVLGSQVPQPPDQLGYVNRKLVQSCRKLCLMWHAGDEALYHEQDFYACSYHDAPALFGEDAVRVHYHLEAMILLGRSACDLAAGAFAQVLPDPFPRSRIDSFNDLCKIIEKGKAPNELVEYIRSLRSNPYSWLSLVAGSERGRSLRDKIAHQTDFPIDYTELRPNSEKESAIVVLDVDTVVPLPEFVDRLRYGVIDGFCHLERQAVSYLESLPSANQT